MTTGGGRVDDWRRLHPLTPLLRGGRSVLVVLTVLGSQGLRAAPSRTVLVLLLLGAGLVAVGAGAVAWRTTRFRVADGELQVDSGVLRRRARRVPLARVQSVDVVRPLAARLLGLAEVRLEVVGGGRTEAPLAFLADADALALRLVLLGGAQASAYAGTAALSDVPPDERVLVRVPTWALVASVLLGTPLVVLLVAVPVLLVGLGLDDLPTVVAAATPFVLGVGGVAGRRVLAEYGSTVSEVPEGLRLRHGLLETRSQTVPPGRVQAVRVVEPLLWRRWGWVRVEVDVAGYGAGRREEASSTSVLLPVAPRALATALVARVLGGGLPPADRPVPRRARLRAPLSRRRLRLGLDDRHLVTTSGVVRTTTDVVPLAKVQSLRLVQGPWQRRLRLATVVADTAGRRLAAAVARHRDADEAGALLEDLSARARAARRAASPR